VLPLETVDIVELESTCRQLRRCWLQAKSHASIFEVLLCDSLDQLLLLHAEKGKYALRRHEHWDKTLRSSESVFKAKKDLYLMMNPKKRRILYKLLAMQYIQGNKTADCLSVRILLQPNMTIYHIMPQAIGNFQEIYLIYDHSSNVQLKKHSYCSKVLVAPLPLLKTWSATWTYIIDGNLFLPRNFLVPAIYVVFFSF
jgi:hypothetical protein